MPHLTQERKDKIKSAKDILEPGELNFFLTEVICTYITQHGLGYQTLNDVSGAMSECLAEFRRQVIVPYENLKISQNGNAYSDLLPSAFTYLLDITRYNNS